ncbi:MAG: hypothetical protein CVU39_15640 [Chloroflexi bacterium HGW-Chloroflexi-10]|nr:MAG: hypothetical protein CVU39_15640 [Chloroflexi bacterium HGW-Chloroflexi-10]
MDTITALENGKSLVAEWVLESATPEPHRLDVWIATENLKAAVAAIMDAPWGYLMTITGLDHAAKLDENGQETQPGMLEGLYHFANGAAVLTLRIKIPYTATEIPSICEIIPSATIYEREFIELLGVDIFDTPDKSRLVLPDTWPVGVYPLRKSFTGLSKEQFDNKEVQA